MNGEQQKPADAVAEEPLMPAEDQWRYEAPQAPAMQEVRWTASEYLAHEKSPMWYISILFGGAVLATLVYFLTKDWVSVSLIALITIIFTVAAGRKPNSLEYALTDHGLEIGKKIYSYSEFRSFALVNEGAFTSVTLMPMKRFMPSIDIFYDPEDEEKVVDVLANVLPMEQHKRDFVDTLIRRLRF